jgi:hypothetical protein
VLAPRFSDLRDSHSDPAKRAAAAESMIDLVLDGATPRSAGDAKPRRVK